MSPVRKAVTIAEATTLCNEPVEALQALEVWQHVATVDVTSLLCKLVEAAAPFAERLAAGATAEVQHTGMWPSNFACLAKTGRWPVT